MHIQYVRTWTGSGVEFPMGYEGEAAHYLLSIYLEELALPTSLS